MMLSKSNGLGSKFSKDEYQNWLAVGYAMHHMNEGIRPYITTTMKSVYNTLLMYTPCKCGYDKSRKNNPWHDMATCAWATNLKRYHCGNPKWHQTDSSKWIDPKIGYWEIAKLFMSDLGKQKTVVVDAWSTDTTGLLNILCWCNIFAPLRPFAEKARDARNEKWAHNPKFELCPSDKNIAIQTIEGLLGAGPLSTDIDAVNALQQIKEINTDFDAQKQERKILMDFIDECSVYKEGVIDALNELQINLHDVNMTRNRDRKEIEGLKKRNERYDISIKILNQRIHSMETNWLGFCMSVFAVFVVSLIKSLNKHSRVYLITILLLVLAIELDPWSHNIECCPNEDRPLSFNLREFNFSRQLNAGKENFVGRRWFYEDVKIILDSSSILMIIGEPGSGKSAIVSNLICSRNSVPSIHDNIIGYHFCQHYNKETCEPGRFIRNLVDMIARRNPKYEKLILDDGPLNDILQKYNCESYPHECFDEAIIIPMKKILKGENQHKILYIVVDGLDECVHEQGRPYVTIVDLLKDKIIELSSQIKIIATTRNDSSVINALPFAKVIHINASDSRNLEDIQFYIDVYCYPPLSDNLAGISQGNFLFVKLLVKYIESERQTSSMIPRTLAEVYERYFRRVFPTRDNFRYIQDVLQILVSVFKPFNVEEIFKTLQLQNSNTELEYNSFLQDLDCLSHFLRYTEDNKVSFFHISLMEWLVSQENKSIYTISKKAGHKKLVLYYMELIKNGQYRSDLPEVILNLAQHIAFGDLLDKYGKAFHRMTSYFVKSYRSKEENSTFLHLASNIEHSKVLELFLTFFLVDIDCKNFRGFTPAFISASRGILDNVKVLVSHGANVNHKTNLPPPLPFVSLEEPVVVAKLEFWNSTMLHAAAYGGHLKIVKFLLEKNATIADRNGVGMTAIQLAAENGHLAIVVLLYKHGAQADQFALYQAALNGHKDVVDFFLKKKVSYMCMRCDGSFYWLNGKKRYQSLSFSYMIKAIPQENFSRYNAETEEYSLIDDRSFLYCETPLHAAVLRGHTEITRLLISVDNSSSFCTDSKGRTPLHVAARKNNLEIMKLLIEAGARVNSKCLTFQHIKRLEHNSFLYNVKRYEHLSRKEEDEYFADSCSCGHTPAHDAAHFGHIDSARLLIQYNGDLLTKTDCYGNSLIHTAACYGQHRFIQWLIRTFREIDINRQNKNSLTPLHISAICGNYEESKQLITDKGDLFALDKNKMTVLHHAALSLKSLCTDREKAFLEDKSLEIAVKKDCLILTELLSYFDDPLDIIVNDAFGRTPLHIAISRGLFCGSNALMAKIPRHELDIKLVHSIWNYLLDNLPRKDKHCQREVLKTYKLLQRLVSVERHK